MAVYYRNLRLNTGGGVYEPAEDSFLLADSLQVRGGDCVLELGTGSGILALVAAEKAYKVLGVDVNPKAVELARENAGLNKIKNVEFKVSNLFQGVPEKFDLILFNPPYLPTEGEDQSWDGGKQQGMKVINRFLDEAAEHLTSGGRIQLLASSLNNLSQIKQRLRNQGFNVKTLATKKMFFETLHVILAGKPVYSI